MSLFDRFRRRHRLTDQELDDELTQHIEMEALALQRGGGGGATGNEHHAHRQSKRDCCDAGNGHLDVPCHVDLYSLDARSREKVQSWLMSRTWPR